MRSALGVIVVVLVALGGPSCRERDAAPVKAVQPQIIWRPVGTWSGHGNRQTESFTSDTGALRVKWDASPAVGAAAGTPQALRITAHSAISGRVLQQVIDRQGPGAGVDYVSQDPHVFYLSVESAGLDWKISVDEGIAGEVVGGRQR